MPFGRSGRLAAACVLLIALPAGARPTLWQRAKNPNARAEARLLSGIERMLDAEGLAGEDSALAQRLARGAVAMIDLERLDAPRDPRLGCAIAAALVDARVRREAEAARLLVRAIPELPVGPLLERAWATLGAARATLGDFAGSRDAETHVLELAWDPEERAVALEQRASAAMQLADLNGAARDYRRAIAEASGTKSQALAHFGLGIALERLGDVPAADAALARGLALWPPRTPDAELELPRGAFGPDYERFYLSALVAQARARAASDADEARAAYDAAEDAWDGYLASAAPGAPFADHARRERERCARALLELPRSSRHAKQR